MNKKLVKKGLIPYIFMFLFMATVLFVLSFGGNKVNELSYDEFLNAMNNSNVEEIVITPLSNANVYEIKGKMKDYGKNESFSVTAPLAEEVMAQLLTGQSTHNFKINAKTDPASSTLLLFINLLTIVGLILYFSRKSLFFIPFNSIKTKSFSKLIFPSYCFSRSAI